MCWQRNARRFGVTIVSAAALAGVARAQIAVTDAESILKMVQSLSNQMQEIGQLTTEIQNERQMLASLGSDSSGQSMSLFNQAQNVLSQLQQVQLQGSAIVNNIQQQYPGSYAGKNQQAIAKSLANITTQQRAAIGSAWRFQNAVVAQQKQQANMVNSDVQASNTAPSAKAATQATNQILQVISHQLATMQALLVSLQQPQQQKTLKKTSEEAANHAFFNAPWKPPVTEKW